MRSDVDPKRGPILDDPVTDASISDDHVDLRARRRRITGMSVVVLLLGALMIGIWLNMHYEMPDRNDPAVVTETARAVAAVERHVTQANGAKSARCAARLLKSENGVAMVHAACELVPGPSALAGPFRVEKDGAVTSARDGDRFETDVQSMFGRRLGDWYLNHANSFGYIRPPAPAEPGDLLPKTS